MGIFDKIRKKVVTRIVTWPLLRNTKNLCIVSPMGTWAIKARPWMP